MRNSTKADLDRNRGKIITVGAEDWSIVSLGVWHEGKVYAHLASTKRGCETRGGWYPIQSCQWIDESLLGQRS